MLYLGNTAREVLGHWGCPRSVTMKKKRRKGIGPGLDYVKWCASALTVAAAVSQCTAVGGALCIELEEMGDSPGSNSVQCASSCSFAVVLIYTYIHRP